MNKFIIPFLVAVPVLAQSPCKTLDRAEREKVRCERDYRRQIAEAAPRKVADSYRRAAFECIAHTIETRAALGEKCKRGNNE